MRIFVSLIIAISGTAILGYGEDVNLKVAKMAFESADKDLNAAYRKAKANLPDFEFEELQIEQRDWLKFREYRAKAAAVYDGGAEEGKEKAHPEYWNTAGAFTEVRAEMINGLVNAESFAGKEWQGSWTDGKGGTLLITENEDGSIQFLTECVRGPTYHTGSISGTAVVNGRTARFSIREEGAEKETWLTFVKRNKKLELLSENASYYHGARAYFDGEYVRTAKLKPGELKKAVQGLEER